MTGLSVSRYKADCFRSVQSKPGKRTDQYQTRCDGQIRFQSPLPIVRDEVPFAVGIGSRESLLHNGPDPLFGHHQISVNFLCSSGVSLLIHSKAVPVLSGCSASHCPTTLSSSGVVFPEKYTGKGTHQRSDRYLYRHNFKHDTLR